MISYEGLFFDDDVIQYLYELEEQSLGVTNDILHCTFKYHPSDKEIFNEIAGKFFEIYLIGYGNDGKNSGFLVDLPDNLKKYYINYDEEMNEKLKVPHITISLAKGARAIDTKNLCFKKLKKPIKIK